LSKFTVSRVIALVEIILVH